MVRWSIVVLTLAALLVAAGCGQAPVASQANPSRAPSLPPASDPAAASHPSPAADGLPWCEDIPMISAPADAYRETPIYVGNEQPTEALRAWAMTKPGFEEIWIDREHRGWVTLAFSEGAAERQAELEAAFPGVGVVAVPVEHSAADLAALQRRVHELLPPDVAGGSSAMVHYGVVEIMIGIATPERIAAVEAAFADQPVCIAGTDPADAPAPGPQQPAGDGWRLLATEETGQPYRTGIAFDAPSLEAVWGMSGVAAPLPAIDWQRDVVIWFGAVYGGGCRKLRLDDVVVDDARQIVHADIVLPDAPAACDSDANPRAFLVALERHRLPGTPFSIQLTADGPPGGVPEERTVVDADLRVPGSVARPEEVHGDARLPLPEFVGSGDVIETGFPAQYRMSVQCGVEWLGSLNGIEWRTPVPNGTSDFLPPAWAQVVAMDGSIVLEVRMTAGPDPIVEATANGHTVVYRPATQDPPGCD